MVTNQTSSGPPSPGDSSSPDDPVSAIQHPVSRIQASNRIPCLRVALSIPVRGTFDYTLPKNLVSAAQVGCRALVPFNRRKVIGYVLETFSLTPDRELKETIDILDMEPVFLATMIPFFEWIADYYIHPIGVVIRSALPETHFKTAHLTEKGADLLTRKRKVIHEWRHLLVPLVPVWGAIVVLIVLEGDLGTTIVMFPILASLLFVVGAPGRVFGIAFGSLVALVALASVTVSYRMQRFRTWLDPTADPTGGGYQVIHGQYGLATGGLAGTGLGASREKWGGSFSWSTADRARPTRWRAWASPRRRCTMSFSPIITSTTTWTYRVSHWSGGTCAKARSRRLRYTVRGPPDRSSSSC